MHCYRVSESASSFRKTFFNSVWTLLGGPGRLSAYGSGRNHERISYHVSQIRFKNGSAVGDCIYGSGQDDGRVMVFLQADWTVEGH